MIVRCDCCGLLLDAALTTLAIVGRNERKDGKLLCNLCAEMAGGCRRCGRKCKTDSQGFCDACDELMAQVMDTQDEYADWDF